MALVTELEGRSWKGHIEEAGLKLDCRNASIKSDAPVIESYDISVTKVKTVKSPTGETVQTPVHVGSINFTKSGFSCSISEPELRSEIFSLLSELEAGIVSLFTV